MPAASRASGPALIFNRQTLISSTEGVKVPNPKDISQLNMDLCKLGKWKSGDSTARFRQHVKFLAGHRYPAESVQLWGQLFKHYVLLRCTAFGSEIVCLIMCWTLKRSSGFTSLACWRRFARKPHLCPVQTEVQFQADDLRNTKLLLSEDLQNVGLVKKCNLTVST